MLGSVLMQRNLQLLLYAAAGIPFSNRNFKMEHRMFSQISKNRRERPLETLQIIVNLIASTTTEAGLTIQCQLDKNHYPKGIKITDSELESFNIFGNEFPPTGITLSMPLYD